MDAKELRIGNYVNWVGRSEEAIIMNGCDFDIVYVNLEDNEIENKRFKPILLNEDWLLKFGFIHAHTCWYEKGLLDTECWFLTFNITSGGKVTLSTDRDEHFLRTIEYVHQLQNLYFALTQKELIIK